MIRRIAIISLLFHSVICGAHQDEAVSEIVQDFENTYHINTESIEIDIVDEGFNEHEVGLCLSNKHNKRVILLKTSYFENATNITRKVLLFHELGHCALNKWLHFDNVGLDGCPLSIMHSQIMPDECFMAHYRELIRNLGEK